MVKKPWLHFVVLGTALFFLQGYFFPEPLPVVGPLAEVRVQALQRQWLATTGRLPAEAELKAMVAAELDKDMLFQEALRRELHRVDPIVEQRLLRNMRFLNLDRGQGDAALLQTAWRMDLHLGDEVIRRRLVQLMEQLLLAVSPPAPVTEAALRARFAEAADSLRQPPRYTLQHVFLPRERAGEAESLLQRFREQSLSPEDALAEGAPFLSGYAFSARTPKQLARDFGAAFVLNLEQQATPEGGWIGPIVSTYGLHLVFLDAAEPARPAQLDEVRAQLARDLNYEYRQSALEQAIASLRSNYDVRL
ncbi:MAG: peptidyl-prolyl cis-trans isomerase [Pseudomonadota bacterium]